MRTVCVSPLEAWMTLFVFVCGRASAHAFQRSQLQPSSPRCVSALLSPLFGEFLRTQPETNVIYRPTQVQTDCNVGHILSRGKMFEKNPKLESRHSTRMGRATKNTWLYYRIIVFDSESNENQIFSCSCFLLQLFVCSELL